MTFKIDNTRSEHLSISKDNQLEAKGYVYAQGGQPKFYKIQVEGLIRNSKKVTKFCGPCIASQEGSLN